MPGFFDPDDDEAYGKELSELLEARLAEFLREHQCMIDGFVGIVTYTNERGDSCWSIVHPEDQLESKSIADAAFLDRWFDEIQRLNIHDHLLRMRHDDDD